MNEPNSKISVLLVDDNEDKLISLEAVLSDMGLNIVRAMSGRDALRCLLSQEFAAILLDVNMPGIDGFETAALIRQRKTCENTPILFITALADEPYVSRGYAMGAVDYILTPVIPGVLRTKVGVFVELHRKNMEVQNQARKLEQRANQLAALAGELAQTEERERRRLAQILHDNLQQLLVAARMRLGMLNHDPRKKEAPIVSQIDALLTKSIDVSRSLTAQLCPPILYDAGVEPAVKWLARHMQEHHSLSVSVSAEGNTHSISEGVRVFIFHALQELLFNVVKHSGVLEASISLSKDSDDIVRVVVRDKGCGFDPSAAPLADAGAEHFGLFNLGERLSRMDGRLDIDSAPGQGTTITLELPDVIAPGNAVDAPVLPALSPAAAPSRRPVAGVKMRVLLVDDHEMMRKGLAALFAELPDIEVVGEAADGPSAIEKALQLEPAVIIIDVSMPGMSGIEATRQIKQRLPKTHIIGLSMHHHQDMCLAMRSAGASAYLTKGGPPEALIAEIRSAAARSVAPANPAPRPHELDTPTTNAA